MKVKKESSEEGHAHVKSVVQFDSTKRRRFSPGTPVSSGSNTGPMRGVPYWTSEENSLGS